METVLKTSESTGAYSSKWHIQLRHSLRSLAFKDKAVYSRLTCTGLLASVLGCICFR